MNPQPKIPELAHAIASHLVEHMHQHADDALWDVMDIARYLRCSRTQVDAHYALHNSFPKPIRLPRMTGKTHKRWLAVEIKNWALTFTERN